jgi:branched-chain amino acid transport system ATP-binding protein
MTVGDVKPTLRSRLAGIGAGAPLLPLVILFGLNAVDELDRGAFSTLLPEIRDHFHLSLTGVTALSTAVIPAALLIGFPIARIADRHRRLPLVIGGATMWGVFSIFTGLVPTVFLLGVARVGAGIGRAVNDPVHSSLLSDYYPPQSRAKVFSTHRAANTVGAFFGPLIAGFVAKFVGWRTPFIVLSIPTFVLIVYAATRLHEPARTGHRSEEGDVRLRRAFSMLWSVRTLRRIWFAFPFISFVVIGMSQIMSLYYKDVFNVSVEGRGAIQAFDAPFIVLGLVIGAPIIERRMSSDPGHLMRIIGLAVVSIGVFMVGIAVAPQLWIAVFFSWGISVLGTVLYAGGFAVLSLVAPPEARASAFACFNIASLLGIVALPVVGIVGDAVGLRWGLAVLAPVILIGSVILASAGQFVNEDIKRIHPEGAHPDVMLPPAPPGPPD